MFPATETVVDPLAGPAGNMTTGNWTVDQAGSNPMTINAGGGASATVDGTVSNALWVPTVAVFLSAFATMAVLPVGAAHFCTVGAWGDPADNDQIYANFTAVTNALKVVTNTGNTGVTITSPAAGDSFGVTYDPGTDLATSWYRPAGTTAWISKSTRAGGLTRSPTGWYPTVASNDATTRLRNFGMEALASGPPQFVHGRGAC